MKCLSIKRAKHVYDKQNRSPVSKFFALFNDMTGEFLNE